MIIREDIKEKLHYDETTGIFTWLVDVSYKTKIGSIAGTLDKAGYLNIKVNGKNHRAHRLAYVYMTGSVPEQVDHINGVRNDNRFSNLRPCNHSTNSANCKMTARNTTGYKGVHFRKDTKNWESKIMVNKKSIHLGTFKDPALAYEAYKEAAVKYFGEYANFGLINTALAITKG